MHTYKAHAFKKYGIVLLRYTLIIALLIYLIVHPPSPETKFLAKPLPRICGWFAEDQNVTEAEIEGNLTYFRSQGADCVNYMTDLPNYERAGRLAQKAGLQIYAWLPAMLGLGFNKKWLYDNHPEVYVVTKTGLHSYYHPVFGVQHYKFLCPNHPIVRTYLKEMYNNVSRIPEIDGINLDYIRYIEGNLRQYNPKGDTCYCDYCVSAFMNKTGINISAHETPNSVKEWADYRVNVITTLVNQIAEIVHGNGKRISADVYPGPSRSTKQTRQKWDDWDLDMVFPMLYTQVFVKDVKWIGTLTGEGVAKLKESNRSTLLYTGLQGEAMNDEDFKQGVDLAYKNGAYGVSVFKFSTINPEKFEIMRNGTQNYLEKKNETAEHH